MIYFVWIVSVVCVLCFIYYALPVMLCRIWLKFSKFEYRLTYDDGPGRINTNEILDMLNRHNQKAAFFLLGKRISGNEKEVKRIHDGGHRICSHGYEHLNYWNVWPWAAIADVKKGWDAIDSALGARNRVYPFRPPNGRLTIFVFLYLLFKGAPIIYWTFDSGDTWSTLPDAFEHGDKCEKKDVILLHDFDRKTDARNKYVIEFTGHILKRLD